MSRWNVFCNESAPYRIYYRQIEIDGYEMYAMFPLPMTGMECGWAVSHGATTAATIQEAVQKFYPFMVEYICDKEDSDNKGSKDHSSGRRNRKEERREENRQSPTRCYLQSGALRVGQ